MPVQRDQRTGVPEVAGPVRTCVGCRRRDSDSRLLRIVHDPQAAALVPDPRRRAEAGSLRGAFAGFDLATQRASAGYRDLAGTEGGAHA